MKKILTLAIVAFISFCGFAQETASIETGNEKFVVSANVSFGYRIGSLPDNISPEVKDHLNKLKSGVGYDLSLYYKLGDKSGIGFKYNAFRSKATMTGATFFAPDGQTADEATDNVTISFYGPSYLFELRDDASRGEFCFEAAAGYIHYRNKMEIGDNYEYNGGSFGIVTGASFKYRITDNFSLGPQIYLVLGAVDSMELTGPNGFSETLSLDEDNAESLSRFDFGITANYHF